MNKLAPTLVVIALSITIGTLMFAIVQSMTNPVEPIDAVEDITDRNIFIQCSNGVTFSRYCGDRINYEELQDIKKELIELKELIKNGT